VILLTCFGGKLSFLTINYPPQMSNTIAGSSLPFWIPGTWKTNAPRESCDPSIPSSNTQTPFPPICYTQTNNSDLKYSGPDGLLRLRFPEKPCLRKSTKSARLRRLWETSETS
jgi:hypothetical protein